MKRLLPLTIIMILLAGCSASPASPSSSAPLSTDAVWTPPESLWVDLSAEAQSALDALELCRAFAEEMNSRYPGYAPVISETDISYYEKHLRDPDADIGALSAELAGTIVQLRQQVYLRMEETSKLFKPLPDGLEQFVREFEERFHSIGW